MANGQASSIGSRIPRTAEQFQRALEQVDSRRLFARGMLDSLHSAEAMHEEQALDVEYWAARLGRLGQVRSYLLAKLSAGL